MKLFQIVYRRQGVEGKFSFTAAGLVPATEWAAKVAQSFYLSNWSIVQAGFRPQEKGTRHVRARKAKRGQARTEDVPTKEELTA